MYRRNEMFFSSSIVHLCIVDPKLAVQRFGLADRGRGCFALLWTGGYSRTASSIRVALGLA